jgi:hypothetical protein
LRLSGRDGFLPWLIVAAAAPRPLIYAHEFAWDRERDPVWKRFQKIYGFYDAADKLGAMNGRGSVSGKTPEATHCNNIGLEHRKGIHPLFKKWFGIDATEYSKRLPSAELQCLTAEAQEQFKPRPLWELVGEIADKRLADAREMRAKLPADLGRKSLRKQLSPVLGAVEPFLNKDHSIVQAQGTWLGRFRYKAELIRNPTAPNPAVPVLWLQAVNTPDDAPVVVGIAQEGKAGFLKHRAETIARLLKAGITVCLPDLRGTGEMRPAGAGRGRTSGDTGASATEWMLGWTNLNRQCVDLQIVLRKVRGPVALWGDSFAATNGPNARVAVPYETDDQLSLGEPTGPLVALLTGLLETTEGPQSLRAIHTHGGLVSYRSILTSPFIYLPHDACAPGMLAVGDIDDIAAACASRPLSIEAMIDAQNRPVTGKALAAALPLARAAGGKTLTVRDTPATPEALAAWFVEKLGQRKQGAGGR